MGDDPSVRRAWRQMSDEKLVFVSYAHDDRQFLDREFMPFLKQYDLGEQIELWHGAAAPQSEAHFDLSDPAHDLHRMPQTGSLLFGRRNEIKLLDDAWNEGETHVVAFTAGGGVAAQKTLAAARKLITDMDYGRRHPELAALEAELGDVDASA